MSRGLPANSPRPLRPVPHPSRRLRRRPGNQGNRSAEVERSRRCMPERLVVALAPHPVTNTSRHAWRDRPGCGAARGPLRHGDEHDRGQDHLQGGAQPGSHWPRHAVMVRQWDLAGKGRPAGRERSDRRLGCEKIVHEARNLGGALDRQVVIRAGQDREACVSGCLEHRDCVRQRHDVAVGRDV